MHKLGRRIFKAAAHIEWVQAAGNCADLHVRVRFNPWCRTLAELQARLDPARFVRVHRSHLVNVDRVASIESLDSGDARLVMKDGSSVPCSRRYRDGLAPSRMG